MSPSSAASITSTAAGHTSCGQSGAAAGIKITSDCTLASQLYHRPSICGRTLNTYFGWLGRTHTLTRTLEVHPNLNMYFPPPRRSFTTKWLSRTSLRTVVNSSPVSRSCGGQAVSSGADDRMSGWADERMSGWADERMSG